MRTLRTISTLLCAVLLLASLPLPAVASGMSTSDTSTSPAIQAAEASLDLDCKSAVLMDAATGTVLYEQNADQALPPASVTKIMTLLLIMEAIDGGTLQLTDPISVSANAASMGGSQVYLEEGEVMSCEDMLKSVVISSANDAAVALAEHVTGDMDTFVRKMNEKAASLGMKNTTFENATGLDDTAQNHLTSARDIAIMSRALIEHKTILNYSSLWMDSIRNGTFGLSNTNRLVRFYRGATGLKTGSTDKAGFCVSVTAQRDGLSLICVIMGAQSSDVRNAQATRLLDWGFANYATYTAPSPTIEPLRILGGEKSSCTVKVAPFSCTLPKGEQTNVNITVEYDGTATAPLSSGSKVGKITYSLGENELGSVDIVTVDEAPRVSYLTLLKRLFARVLLC